MKVFESACGKIRYDKKTAQTMRNSRTHRHNGAKNLWIYQCPRCNGWHLSSKPPYPRQFASITQQQTQS